MLLVVFRHNRCFPYTHAPLSGMAHSRSAFLGMLSTSAVSDGGSSNGATSSSPASNVRSKFCKPTARTLTRGRLGATASSLGEPLTRSHVVRRSALRMKYGRCCTAPRRGSGHQGFQ